MAFLDPKDAYEHLQSRVLEGIQAQFPLKGKVQSLHLDKLEVKNDLHPDDLKGQHEAKVSGETWAEPVFAHLSLKDNETGKVLDQRRIRVAEIPKTTSRYSYIVDGQEYQVDNQWQLKPGVYARRDRTGTVEAHFNVTGKGTRAFDLVLDPEKKVFSMQYGKSKSSLPLYPLLHTMGIEDADLEKAWGKDMLEANKKARGAAGALEAFYKATKKVPAPSKEVAAQHFFDVMHASEMRPEATEATIGKALSTVNGEALKLASQKMLKVHAGHPEDDRDSLMFKDLRTTGDFAYDMIRNAGQRFQDKARRKINTAKEVRDILKFEHFNIPLKDAFTKNNAARVASQINPVEMISSALQTTVMGPGGIKSERSITDEAKFVNASHLGFIDPINTPEGEKTGVTLRLPVGIKKDGHEVKIRLHNLRTGELEAVSPTVFARSSVVLPDQVHWVDGKPKPIGKTVRMSTAGNEVRDGKFSDAQYVVPHSWQLFNMTSNLIPFLANTSGGRASMASRQMEQAISLVHREPPLVQVGTGMKTKATFEDLVGQQASHATPVDGKVTDVTKHAITIEEAGGEKHKVQLYNNYPLTDAKGIMHSTPLVKPGDTVKRGQTIADTNFSKGGTLALGTNLRTAYIPFKGYNFEDGIVISESAAKKLTSAHLQKEALPLDDDLVLNKRKFQIEHPGVFKRAQLEKLDADGVVAVGQVVHAGDPLVAAMKPYNLKDRTGLAAIRRSMSGGHTDKSLRWDSEFEGEVVGVHKSKKGLAVHVRTIEPMQVGDKMAGRYGNKGIVTMILPDREMPHTKDGKHIEVALNPSGVPGRMNVGQLLETAAGKIAQKTGKPYIVQNFEPNVDALARVKADLKEHGLEDAEELFDPATKHSLGKVMVGPQHHLKLVHQVEKKLSVRSGMNLPGMSQEHYDLNLQPTSGSGTGGQSMGTLGLYALLAHGAKHNIREMQTFKSEGPDGQSNPAKRWPSDHDNIWAAIQAGRPLPTPKTTFAFQKFHDMLRGAGVNMEKKGHELILTPLTDDQIRTMAKKELPNPADLLETKVDKNGDLKPKPGGLFDEALTGGHGGRQWTRIKLAEPVPNPVFEKPIRSLLGLSGKDFTRIVHGEAGVTPNGHITDTETGITGGAAIKLLLDRVEVDKELPRARAALTSAKGGPAVDRALKKVKYLVALQDMGMKPSEAYVLHNVPVLPPVMRPVSMLPDGSTKFADVNQLYSSFAKVNDKLKDPVLSKNLTDSGKQELRRDFYDGVKAFMGMGVPYAQAEHKGLLHQISGSSPKYGYFQSVLINRRQDMTMRSTIVPEPALGLDEVGIPRHAALDLYRPFVVRKLKEMGAIPNELQGPALIEKKTPAVWRALDKVMDERPVLLKRDPALHKYSVQAFKARPVEGSAVKIHPLVTGGFNADFDGDTMSAFVPITREAVAEAHKMYPSNNLFSEATGKVMYQPTLESALGLYKLSLKGKDTHKSFKHPGEALDEVRKGALHINDVVHLEGKKTTAGRMLLASAVPEGMQQHVMHDISSPIDRDGLDTLLGTLAKNHHGEYGEAVNRLKDLGNGAAFGSVTIPRPTSAGHPFSFRTVDKSPVAVHDNKSIFVPIGAHTLTLDDFTPDRQMRDHVIGLAHKKVEAINLTKLPQGEKDRQAVAAYKQAGDEMKELHEKKQEKNPNNLFTMYQAGVKPGWDQYKQMVLAPLIYKDSSDKEIPTPVTKSYSEGLDIGGYWTQMHGARRGSVMKTQSVKDPGVMSKRLMANMMHILVNETDCGTAHGIALDVHEKDLHDRYLQQDFKHGHLHIPAGTLLTPDVIGKVKAAKKDAKLIVRSPLKCESETGICQKCIGLGSGSQHLGLGTNIGVHSAQALGERAIQLTLKSFHTGGVGEQRGSKLLSSFERFRQLMAVPKTIPDEMALAMKTGTIEKIDRTGTGVDIVIDGRSHHVGKDTNGILLHQNLPNAEGIDGYVHWSPPKVGMKVQAGAPLSDPNRTFSNPRRLYEATGSMEKVQNEMANEIYSLYKKEGIKRRHVETVVKAMTNLTQVVDPGDHERLLRGEYRPLSVVNKLNRDLAKEGKELIEHKPVLKGIEALPLELLDDWMAKLQHTKLRETLSHAAATTGAAHIHGSHPIPGIAFGSEFGLTKADSLKPGFGQLKNVPEHVY